MNDNAILWRIHPGLFFGISRCMHKWMDQFGCHVSQFYLVVAIVISMLFNRSCNLLKWTWFLNINLNIYIMHKIILQILKNRKSHRLLNSKLMDYTFDYQFFVDYDIVHWLVGCVRDLKLIKYHNKEAKGFFFN
jgi:hypothetical protein